MAEKLRAQPFKPVASPPSLRLAVPQFTALERLSRSLDEFGANVAGTTVRLVQASNKKAFEKGEEAAELARAEGLTTFDELEEAGIISKGEHPRFIEGVFTSLGIAKAAEFDNALTVAYAENVDPQSTDLDDVEVIFAQVSEQFAADGENAHATAAFAPIAAASADRIRKAHAGRVAQNMVTAGNEALQLNYMADLNQHSTFTGPNRIGEITSLLLATQAKWMDTNGKNMTPGQRRKMNRTLVDSVELMLDEIGGTFTGADATEILTRIGGKRGSLMNVTEHGKKINAAITRRSARIQTGQAQDQTAMLLRQQETAAAINNDFANTGYTREGLDEAIRTVELLNNANPLALDAGFKARLIKTQADMEALGERDVPLNRLVDNQLVDGMLSADITTTAQQIADAAILGDIPRERAAQLQARLTKAIEEVRNDPRMKAIRSDVAHQLHGVLGGYTPTSATEMSFLSARGKMYAAATAWAAENPTKDHTSPEYEEMLLPLIRSLQEEFQLDAAPVLRVNDNIRSAFEIREFSKIDYNLSRGQLVDLMAQNELLADGDVDYSADDSYYDYLFQGDSPLSRGNAKNTRTALRAITSQLTFQGLTSSNLTAEITARKEQLLQVAAMRSPEAAAQQQVAGSSFVAVQQAEAMGLTPAEVDTLETDWLLKLAGESQTKLRAEMDSLHGEDTIN